MCWPIACLHRLVVGSAALCSVVSPRPNEIFQTIVERGLARSLLSRRWADVENNKRGSNQYCQYDAHEHFPGFATVFTVKNTTHTDWARTSGLCAEAGDGMKGKAAYRRPLF